MNFLLSDKLTDFQLKLLEFIQYLREELKGAKQARGQYSGEPIITLQYSYIVALFGCSHSTVKKALDRLSELKLIQKVSNTYKECATYQYSPREYASLIRKAKGRDCILITGRNKHKQRNKVSARKVLQYMTGKAITKAIKQEQALTIT